MIISILSILSSISFPFATTATCSISNSALSYSAYFTITSSVSITSSLASNYLYYYDTCDKGSILATSDSSLYQIVSTSATTKFYFNSLGSKPIAIMCMDQITEFSFTILSLKLLSSFDSQPIDTNDIFSITVGVYDNSGTYIESSNGQYSISLQFLDQNSLDVTATVLEGNVAEKQCTNGVCIFSSLRIKSSGQYKIKAVASDSDITVYETSFFSINYGIQSIELLVDTINTPCFHTFIATVNLYNTNGDLYEQACDVILVEQGGAIIYGDYVDVSVTKTKNYSIYFANSGTLTIKATYGTFSDTKIITIRAQEFNAVINTIPTSTRDIFSVEVTMCSLSNSFLLKEPYFANPIDFTLVCNNHNEQCTIYDQDNDIVYDTGVINVQTIAGTCTFTSGSLIIYTPGLTDIKIIDPYQIITTFTTESFTPIDHVKTIVLSSDTMTPSIYFNFIITIELIRYDNKPYLSSSIIDLIDNHNINHASETITGGSGDITLFITTTGSLTLNVLYDTKTASIILTFQTLKLKYSDISYPSDSKTPLVFTVGIYNFEGDLLENSSNNPNGYNVLIELFEDGECSGHVKSDSIDQFLINAELIINNLYVYSSGSFILTASITNILGILEANSDQFTIINYVKTITAIIDTTNPSINFDVLIEAYFIGDDDLDFILPLTVTLEETTSQIFDGNKVSELETGFQCAIVIWFPLFGLYNLRITTSSSSEFYDLPSINVQKNVLKMIEPNPMPVYNIDIFSILFEVYDASENIIESERGSYEINVFFESSINTFNDFITTSNGKFTLTKVLDNGNYTVSASCLLTENPDSFYININEGLMTLDISSNNFTQLKNYIFNFEVILQNKAFELFLIDTNILLSCEDEDFEAQNKISHNGIALFDLYFTNIGNISCILTTNSDKIYKNFVFEIVNSTMPNLECEIALDSEECFRCVKNSTMDEKKQCSCINLSSYSPQEGMCVCDPDKLFGMGICYNYGNYFALDEIKAYFSQDFTQIIVSFARQVNQTNIDCMKIYNFNIKTIKNSCYWSSDTTLTIQFIEKIYSKDLNITFDPTQVQAIGFYNLQELSPLEIVIETRFPLPIPEASLIAPEIISISCLKKDVIIFTRTTNDDYLYFWNATFDSNDNVDITNLNNYMKDSIKYYIVFTKDFFTKNKYINGNLTINLEVKSKLFETRAISSIVSQVINKEIVMIGFTAGNSINITSNRELNLKIQVFENCDLNDNDENITKPLSFNITSLDDEMIIDKASIKRDDYIQLPPYSLKPNKIYRFLAKAIGGNKSGSSSIIVKVNPSEIEISISRSSGNINKRKNLEIIAYAKDPDKPNADLYYYWNCTEGILPCNDSNNKILSFNANSPHLIVDKNDLRDTAIYSFHINVIGIDKSRNFTIEITIDNQSNGEIVMNPLTSSVNNDQAILITPEIIQEIEDANYLWTFSPSLTDKNNYTDNESYIYIPSNTLDPGYTYKLELCMSKPNIKGVCVFTFITRNPGAICKNFTANFWENDIWILFGEQCMNPEKEDIVNYQYGVRNNMDYITWITPKVLINPIYLKAHIPYMFVVKVCDEEDNCNMYETFPINSTSRKLQDDIELEFYKKLIEDPDKIPEIVDYYSLNTDDSDILLMLYNETIKYFEYLPIDSAALYSALECFKILLSNKNLILENYNQEPLDFINYLLYKYNFILDENQTALALDNFQSIILYNPLETQINSFFSILTRLTLSNHIIGYDYQYLNDMTYYVNRMYSIYLSGGEFDIDSNNLNFPFYRINNQYDIYDLVYYRYELNKQIFSKLLVYYSGTHNLSATFILFEQPLNINLELIEPIIITIYGNFNVNDNEYDCYQKVENKTIKCEAKVKNYGSIEIKSNYLGSYEPVLIEYTCVISYIPICILAIIYLLFSAYLVFICTREKNSNNPNPNNPDLNNPDLNNPDPNNPHPDNVNQFFKLCPLVIIIRSPNLSLKVESALRILSCETLLFALIPFFMKLFENPLNPKHLPIWEFSIDHFIIAMGALSLSTLLKGFLYIISINQIENASPKISVFIIISCAFIFILSSIEALIESSQFCESYVYIWLEYYIIFLVIDITISEMLNICIIPKKHIRVRPINNQQEINHEDTRAQAPNSSRRFIGLNTEGTEPENQRSNCQYNIPNNNNLEPPHFHMNLLPNLANNSRNTLPMDNFDEIADKINEENKDMDN
ncbi:hypothetical protein SteCoe_30311 [Stentor coeruleus]|uniref:GPS domain-containing protein n=1 Tax=Stentor coeruleus TaxID=5963 RepID=A0A1R2B468_9CILI|nr:hypothetical protein SteCoe_30311 [Stentor coeruleus]